MLWKHSPRVPIDGYPEIAKNILAGKGFSPDAVERVVFPKPGISRVHRTRLEGRPPIWADTLRLRWPRLSCRWPHAVFCS